LQPVERTAKAIRVRAEEGTVISVLYIRSREAVAFEVRRERYLTLSDASKLDASALCSGEAETVL
jgi:hypothetical protein